MKRYLCGAVLLLAVFGPVSAAEPQWRVIRNSWYESRTDSGKLGYMHLQAQELEIFGRRFIRTVVKEELNYKRSGDPFHEKMEHDTLETPSGQVIEVGYTTNLSKKQHLTLRGRVDAESLVLRAYMDGKETPFTQKIPWPKDAIGNYANDSFFEGKTLKPGEVLTLKSFHLTANRVVPTIFTVKGTEKTSLGKEDKELLRIEQTHPKEVYLGKSSLWIDKKGLIVKMQEDTPLFGMVTYYLVTEEEAKASFKPRVADVESPIGVNKPIVFNSGPPKEIILRISREDDDEPGTLFAQDSRQVVVKADKEKVELKLTKAEKMKVENPAEPPAEFLESNFFIRSDDALVTKYAKEAIGDETDRRKQVEKIGKWIKRKVAGNYEIPFATADEVARCLEGDCSEMGVIGAAMCRSVGVPSRVVFGLVYDRSNPGFGGHLWCEVYLDGQWETWDPTGVLPLVHAAYIKIADYSMKDVLNPDELKALRRAFSGKMKVEVVDLK